MISILMPLYNGKEFLHDSIISVLNQTYTSWELLIGINGLPKEEYDEIKNIINTYYQDDRIKIFLFDFKSKTKTLNYLLKKSLYNYICLLDVDDYWMPTKLEIQLQLIKNYDVVGTNCKYFDEKFGSPGLFLGEISSLMFSYQNPIINSSVMIRRNDLWWDTLWEGLDDYNLWSYLLSKNKTFYNILKSLTYHRIHKTSYFNNKNENETMSKKLIEEKFYKLTEEEYQELNTILTEKKWKIYIDDKFQDEDEDKPKKLNEEENEKIND